MRKQLYRLIDDVEHVGGEVDVYYGSGSLKLGHSYHRLTVVESILDQGGETKNW